MLALDKMEKAKEHLEVALMDLQLGNKRLAVGKLDHCKEDIIAAIHILINEIKDEEGKF